MKGISIRLALGLALCLLAPGEARAALQDIDFGACPNPPAFEIDTVVGNPVNLDIGLVPPDGNFFWAFDPPPSDPPCTPAGAGAFNCNGITLTLPAGAESGASVPGTVKAKVSGAPTATATAFDFTLLVSEDGGPKTCSRVYHVLVHNPVDVVFVLDRSGSMAETSKISPPAANRWDALKIGVNNFTPMLETTAAPGSRFGLTLFAGSVIPNISFPAGLSPFASLPGGLAAAVNAEMTAQTPSGGTAMGPGLADAKAKLSDPSHPRVMVLFTDGEQNVAPLVSCPAAACPPGPGCEIAGVPLNPTCPGASGSLKLVTVAIGNPDASYLATLQRLASQNRGKSIITGNAASFTGDCLGNPAAAFACAIEPALSGSSPQVVATASGVLSGTVAIPAFEINRYVEKVLIQISLSRNFERPSLIRLLEGLRILKDGADVTSRFKPIVVGNFTSSVLLRADFKTPASGVPPKPEGEYKIEWTVPPSGAGGAPALEYRLVAFADDHRLDLDWKVAPEAPRAGERFRPTVDLSWLSHPVKGAKVEALILKPGDDLGDLLARSELRVRVKEGADAGSPGYQKYLELLKDPDFLARLLPSEQRLQLEDQGGGVYSAEYDPGEISGVYQVFYFVRASDAAFGRVQRQGVESVYVRFGEIDLAASEPQVAVDGSQIVLTLRPMTRFRRFLGPANAAAIAVEGSRATVRSILDQQDGSYRIALDGDPRADISVSILGEEIYRGPAEGFGKDPHVGGGTGGESETAHPCSAWPRWLRWLCHAFKG